MNILSSKLKRALELEILPDNRKSSSVYPSSASIKLPDGKTIGACLRQQYYRAKGEPVTSTTPADYRLSALMGDKASLLVQELLDTLGFTCGLQRIAAEHSFHIPHINLSGRSDFVAYDHSNKEFIGIEVKSVGEYKASKAIESPVPEHVLQSLIYLDYYSSNFPTLGIKKWYILYISRTENYSIKAKKHGSPIAMLWDYHISTDPNDGAAIIYTARGVEKWKDYTVQNIYSRFQQLNQHISTDTLPDRDYTIRYSDEAIVELYQRGLLTRKMDKEKVEKWLKKGAPEGKLKVEIADQECIYCAYKATCWPNEFPVENIVEPIIKNDKVSEEWF